MVSFEEANRFALNNNMSYIETSAKTSLNVNDSFENLANLVFLDIKTGKIKMKDNVFFKFSN